jgi:ribonuclease R
MSTIVVPDQVFSVLSAAGEPLKAKEVARLLGVAADDRALVRAVLRQLVGEGRVVALPGRRFVTAAATSGPPETITGVPLAGPGDAERRGIVAVAGHRGVLGVVQRKVSGIGWFIPDDKTQRDAFLPPAELRAVMDGDRVLARIGRGTRGPSATIVEVVARTRTSVTGVLRTVHDPRRGRDAWVEVDDNLLTGAVRIVEDGPRSHEPDIAANGDVVEVQIVTPPSDMHPATGRILRRIGRRGELDCEIERLVVQAGVVRAFPPDVLAAAGVLGDDPDDDDLAGRLDVRDQAIVTIDGETAKDFDDAVFARRPRKDGPIEVTVCVADVSHYVQKGQSLDREARRRSTSIYYPGRVIPMLPEALSNGLCSLRPAVPRLCAIVRFLVDDDGNVAHERFDFGVMKSRARLTYSLAQRFFDEEDGVPEPYVLPPQPREAPTSTAALDDEVRASLRLLRQAALRIRKNRAERGALDFELPELVIELDPRREPIAIRPLQRAFAHKLIEDLMIAANEAAARFFFRRSLPSIYRIHELPDEEKLGRFLSLAAPAYLAATGKKLPNALLEDPSATTTLMAVMNELGDHPSRQALDMLLLRSMKQARYAVLNVGHYGLGSTAYLHFTSPIRRYPDLVVHRLMRQALAPSTNEQVPAATTKKPGRAEGTGNIDAQVEELEDIATTSSEQERKASELERSIQALHACWLMKDRIGEHHEAIVTGVSEAGAFVRLTELFVEGLVRIAELGPEFYVHDEARLLLRGERSGELITLGTRFTVEVTDVDFSRRQIAFVRPRRPVNDDRIHRFVHGGPNDPGHDTRPPVRGARPERPPAGARIGRDERYPAGRHHRAREHQRPSAQPGSSSPRPATTRPETETIESRFARWRAVAEDDRAVTRARREKRYDQQQRGAHKEGRTRRPSDVSPTYGTPRPRLRGPDDLRALLQGGSVSSPAEATHDAKRSPTFGRGTESSAPANEASEAREGKPKMTNDDVRPEKRGARPEPARQTSPGQVAARPEASRKDASRKDPSRKDASRKDASRKDASRKDASRKDASRKDPSRKDPSREDASRKDPSRKDASRKDPSRKDPSRKDASRKDPSRKDASRKDASRKDASRKDASRKDASRGDRVQQKRAPKSETAEKEAPRRERAPTPTARKTTGRPDAMPVERARHESSQRGATRKSTLKKTAPRRDKAGAKKAPSTPTARKNRPAPRRNP